MYKVNPTLTFVTRRMYDSTVKVIKDYKSVSERTSKVAELSVLTLASISMCDELVNRVIFDTSVPLCVNGGYASYQDVNREEERYLRSDIKTYLGKENNDYIAEDKKYYEIIPEVTGGFTNYLVIMEEGFLDFVVGNKDNCLQFFLDSLNLYDKYNSFSGFLLGKYIGLKTDEGVYSLMKMRYGS